MGTVEPGKLADLIIVDGDPLTDIRCLDNQDNIQLVMKDGRILKDIREAGQSGLSFRRAGLFH